MDRHGRWDRVGEGRDEPSPARRAEPSERPIAPPIEREHETQAGIFEEDERRERQRQLEREGR